MLCFVYGQFVVDVTYRADRLLPSKSVSPIQANARSPQSGPNLPQSQICRLDLK